MVALLSEEPPREYGDDLAAALRAARRGQDGYAGRWKQEVRRLSAQVDGGGAGEAGGGGRSDDAAVGLVAALAFPERVARARGDGAFLMVSGTGAELREGSRLRSAPWLAVAVADRPSHAASARVRLAAVVDEETALAAAGRLRVRGEEVRWTDGDVVARSVDRLGAVELAVRPLKQPDTGLVRGRWWRGCGARGSGCCAGAGTRSSRGRGWRSCTGCWGRRGRTCRTGRCSRTRTRGWSRSCRGRGGARIWGGWTRGRRCGGCSRGATGEAARLDELAPERIEVPSGSRIRVEYGGEQPVLAVKLQEVFGLAETPRVAGVPVLVHLLSPAGRPAAVTADLASFWREGYRAVRAELRGRYPKHPWPEDPATVPATRFTTARLKRS